MAGSRFWRESRPPTRFCGSRRKFSFCMATFIYKAVNTQGKSAEGRLEAADSRMAAFRLQGIGPAPVSVEESSTRAASVLPAVRFQRVSRKDILLFTEELSTLVRAGLPLDRSLSITAELAAKPALRRVIQDVLTQIKGGKSLAEALSAHPKYFTRLYVNMIRAGEAGGILDVILARLVELVRAAGGVRSGRV